MILYAGLNSNEATTINNILSLFYKYIKSKQQIKDNIGPLKRRNGEVSSISKLKAEEFYNFVTSSFTRANTENILNPKIQFEGNSDEKLTDIDITPELVKNTCLS